MRGMLVFHYNSSDQGTCAFGSRDGSKASTRPFACWPTTYFCQTHENRHGRAPAVHLDARPGRSPGSGRTGLHCGAHVPQSALVSCKDLPEVAGNLYKADAGGAGPPGGPGMAGLGAITEAQLSSLILALRRYASGMDPATGRSLVDDECQWGLYPDGQMLTTTSLPSGCIFICHSRHGGPKHGVVDQLQVYVSTDSSSTSQIDCFLERPVSAGKYW
eukprot:jgi/Botrbrau1/1147/Bobra.0162s0038.1